MIPFRLRRDGDRLVILTRRYYALQHKWLPSLVLDRVWAANLAQELDLWLAGLDELPEAGQ